MEIQGYPDDLNWVNAQLAGREQNDQSFLGTFCNAALRADDQNYEMLRPVLLQFQNKYPADPHLLAAERTD